MLELVPGHGLVRLMLVVDRLGEKLAEVTAHIVDQAPLGVNLPAEVPAGTAIDVDESLERHAGKRRA